MTVEATAGVVVEVYPQKSGTSKFGPWTIQKLILADGDNARIEVKLVNVGAFQKDAINHRLYLIAAQGKKGLTGLKTELDTYNGRNELILAVEKQAELTFEAPRETTAAAPAPPAPPTTQAASRPTAPKPPTPPKDPLPGNEDPPDMRGTTPTPPSTQAPKAPAPPTDARQAWKKVDKKLLTLVRARVRCECAAQQVKRQLEAMGITVGADHLEKIASWLTIEAGRSGIFADIPDIDPPPLQAAPDHH